MTAAPRAPKTWRVGIKNGSGQLWAGTSVEVSAGGMRVRVDGPLDWRGLMFVAFTPEDGRAPMWANFSLVREIGPGEYAIRFLGLPPKNVERLHQVVKAALPDRRSHP